MSKMKDKAIDERNKDIEKIETSLYILGYVCKSTKFRAMKREGLESIKAIEKLVKKYI